MPSHTKFRKLENINDALLSEQLEANLSTYFNWAFLELGAFANVTIPTSGNFGGYFHKLKLSNDRNYTVGRVWEGVRKGWVWESGIERSNQPIHISGVFVNGAFQPATGIGPYKHIIDYPNGRVVFDTAISTTTNVTCEYSYRTVHVYTAGNISHFKKDLQFNSYRVDDSSFLQFGSGEWQQPAAQRIQLPAIIVDAEPKVTRDGYQLGTLVHNTHQEVTLHIYTENDSEFKKFHDILTYQQETTIRGFDKKSAIRYGKFGLDFNGSPLPSALCYPDLINSFLWKEIVFERLYSNGLYEKEPLYYCPIKATCLVLI